MHKNQTQKDAGLANLIQLNDAATIDAMSYHDEWLEEGQLSKYDYHLINIDDQICRELNIPNISSGFMQYYWHGFFDERPWSKDDKGELDFLAFDPEKISLIVPVTNAILQIRGENRKIVLTFPAMYDGRQPFYHVVCSSERQIENVRVLNSENSAIGNPFYGLERIFTQRGFRSLPKLENTDGLGLIHVDRRQIVVPSTSREYF